MILETIINISYLIGAIAFVIGLQKMGSPDTARKGNIYAAIGMGIAIVATLIAPIQGGDNNYTWIGGGFIIGGLIGWMAAKKVQMTDMPQLVSIFNGLGGACAVVLAMTELRQFYTSDYALTNGQIGTILATLLIGAIAFTGSLLAYGKLQGLVKDKHVVLPGHSVINMILLLVTIGLTIYVFSLGKGGYTMALILMGVALIYGFSFVAPIGGADMPVVISLLNSFTGLSAAAAGLIYGNNIMLIGGILVGASGTILTVLMTKAMNRSLMNVLIGGFGGGGKTASKGADGEQVAKEVTINDAAIQLYYSNTVIIVPGYGLAVAQAQKVCKEMDDMLSANGVDVKYAIHPVAGRMPGHMNVLLAEADVPYPKLLDLEEANDALPKTDLVVVVGANDVVNPAANDDPSSPIHGMPVLNVWEAKNVIILKRSMSTGYAGIQNQLFFKDNAKMLFGDAKKSIQEVVGEIKTL